MSDPRPRFFSFCPDSGGLTLHPTADRPELAALWAALEAL